MAKRRLMAVAVLVTVVSVIIFTLEITKRPYAKIKSPDGKLQVTIAAKGDTPEEVYTVFNIKYNGETIVDDSKLGISTENGGLLGKNVEIYSYDLKEDIVFCGEESTELQYSELTVNLHERIQPFRNYFLVLRIFDNGIAYRYYLQGRKDNIEDSITSVYNEYKFTRDYNVSQFSISKKNNVVVEENLPALLTMIDPETYLELPMIFGTEGDINLAVFGIENFITQLTGVEEEPLMLQTVEVGYVKPDTIIWKTPWQVMLLDNNLDPARASHLRKYIDLSER